MISSLSNASLISLLKLNFAKVLHAVLLIAVQPVQADSLASQLVDAAMERTRHSVRYDGSYVSIPYPNGDVPDDTGVCTDVVIRSYRQLDVDLQKLVHEDMDSDFDVYPSRRIWGLKRADSNIDHRRVANLQTFFTRHGKKLQITNDVQQYKAGDLVTWMLPGNLPHIGIVTDKKAGDGKTPMIVHNVGAGPKLENILFSYKITGHYRYFPEQN